MPLDQSKNNRVLTPKSFPQFKKLTDDSAVMGLNLVIFGPPGAGKTTFSLSAQSSPLGADVLLHDCDKGRESVLDIDGASFYVPESWKELRGNLDIALAMKDESPYKTHVFDSLSTIYHEYIFPEVQRKSPNVRDPRQWYFEAQKMLVHFVRDAKSLAEYEINTIFTGHVLEDKETDEKGNVLRTTVRLSLPEKVRNEVLLYVNHVGYLTRGKRDSTRELYFEPPNSRVDGPKIRVTKSSGVKPEVMTDPDMTKLFKFLGRV